MRMHVARMLWTPALLMLFAPIPAWAATATPSAPAAPVADASAATPAVAPAIPPAATSSLTITLGTTGDFDRKTVSYGCQGDQDSLAVDYLNAAPNYLALIPLDGSTLVFNTVLSGSGAKYVAGKYVWWTKGSDASLYDLTEGDKAKPILTCSEVNETP
jgi:membrane-bound inhibitor of C-type lysozyme